MSPIDTAKLYFKLSNQRNLDMIEALLHEDATYNSNATGIYEGRLDIMKMMRTFFEKFEYIEWKIDSIDEILDGTIEIYFHAIFQNQSGTIEKNGIEKIIIKDNSIFSIEVKNN